MDCATVLFSAHVVRRMYERGIDMDDLLEVIRGGEPIEEYPEDVPFPSRLVLGYVRGRPIHAVVARDAETSRCFAVTVYEPEPGRWSPDFRRRR